MLRQFVDAVLALSDVPEPANVERYLKASRALEESRRSRKASAGSPSHRSREPRSRLARLKLRQAA